MLNLLKPGTGIIVKRTKYGFYIDMPYQKNIFIHYSDTLDESIFKEEQKEKTIDYDKQYQH